MKFFFSTASADLSGVNTANAVTLKELRRQGHDARILVPNDSFQSQDFPELTSDELVFFDAMSHPTWQGKYRSLISFLQRETPCVFLPVNSEVYSAVCPQLPDCVRTVGLIQSDEEYHYQHIDRVGDSWNACICVSEHIAREARKRFPRLKGKFTAIPNAVRIPEMPVRTLAQELRIIYTGRLDQRQKRILDIPEIACQLAKKGVQFHITIVGTGSDEGQLRQDLKTKCPDAKVHFPGRVAHDEVLRLLGLHDVFLLTSEFEGTSLSLLEAMALGVVPVVTNVKSGVPELIDHGINGFLFEIGDTGSCADILAQIGSRKSMLEDIGKQARNSVESNLFNVRHQVRALIQLIDQIPNSQELRVRKHGTYAPPNFVNLSWEHNLKRWIAFHLKKRLR